MEESENLRLYGQNKQLFWDPGLELLGNYRHVSTCKNFFKNTKKMN